jgi:hypothetical protein
MSAKSMKKAQAKYEEARRYVASYSSKPKPVPAPKPMPVVEPVKVETKPKGIKVESAEIKKLEKGHFFVVVTYGGKRHEIQKRFKSTTKAQEWISKHEYIEV